MSPEQARGKPADKRSDVWSFGCVLYEMMTGTRVFEDDDIADTLASVLKREPDWNQLPDTLPSAISVLVRRCLAKDPRQRCGDMAAALILLEESIPLSAVPTSADTAAEPWSRAAPRDAGCSNPRRGVCWSDDVVGDATRSTAHRSHVDRAHRYRGTGKPDCDHLTALASSTSAATGRNSWFGRSTSSSRGHSSAEATSCSRSSPPTVNSWRTPDGTTLMRVALTGGPTIAVAKSMGRCAVRRGWTTTRSCLLPQRDDRIAACRRHWRRGERPDNARP